MPVGRAERPGTVLQVAEPLRRRTTGDTRGFMRALVGERDEILGFTMLSADAGEVMAVALSARVPRA